MTDKRELILARISTVLGTVAGVITNVRNREHLQDDELPATYLLDADETANEAAFNRGREGISPNLVILQPEIYVRVKNQMPDNLTVGPLLNDFRIKVLKAIGGDAPLLALLGGNGEVQYLGCVTDMARRRPMEGEMGLIIAFKYAFKPSEM